MDTYTLHEIKHLHKDQYVVAVKMSDNTYDVKLTTKNRKKAAATMYRLSNQESSVVLVYPWEY